MSDLLYKVLMGGIVVAIVVLVLIAGGVLYSAITRQPTGLRVDGTSVRIWHDDQRSVTCWITKEGYSGGIACLPDRDIQPR